MTNPAESYALQESPGGSTPASASAAETSVSSRGPEVMLDVHAPHEPIHSWKSFAIHIAAIVIGLLIAVGLEQGVEFFHHRHQRHQLEGALRQDGEGNRPF